MNSASVHTPELKPCICTYRINTVLASLGIWLCCFHKILLPCESQNTNYRDTAHNKRPQTPPPPPPPSHHYHQDEKNEVLCVLQDVRKCCWTLRVIVILMHGCKRLRIFLHRISRKWLSMVGTGLVVHMLRKGGFIKDEYCSWVEYKSGPGGGPSM